MKRTLTLLLFASALTFSEAASADTILYFETSRLMSLSGGSRFLSGPGFWSESITRATATSSVTMSQETNLTNSFMGGAVSATAEHLAGSNDVASTFQMLIDFAVEGQPHVADLSVLLSATGSGRTFVEFHPRTANSSRVSFQHRLSDGTMELIRSFVLLPGLYHFRMDVSATTGFGLNSGIGSFNGGLTLTPVGEVPVPEPASMTLFGLGLAAVAARRRFWNARN